VDDETVAEKLRERTGAVARVVDVERPGVPPGVLLDDGLTEEEAVAVALWNSEDFQVGIAELGFARADLLEAGLLRNPVLALLFPIGPKQLEATLRFPVEVLWERPRRVAAANVAMEAAAERLVQTGLDLAAAVKAAHADLLLGADRLRLAEETAEMLRRIDQLTRSRLVAGDISELEARAARVDAARAGQEAVVARYEVEIADAGLRGLLGFAVEGPELDPVAEAPRAEACGPVEDLLADALASRPDLRAAELGVEGAAARLGWERSRVLALTAVLDANGSGQEGFEMGPGLDIGIPIFDRNQVGRARADAALRRAAHTYAAARQRVATEVVVALARYDQSREARSQWRDAVTVPLEENVAAAEASFAAGDVSYLFVLENTRRLAEARLRGGEIDADLRRARARLERATGRACAAPETEPTNGL
jgi:cobalt-zinc-cadmium efflux system outer membrane protein